MGNLWPNGARCVVAITVDFDGTGNEIGRGLEPVGVRAAGGYSARRGIPRMLDIFAKHEIAVTFFVPGYDAEMNPDLVRRIAAAGHEVAAHGYLHEGWAMSPDEEEALLRKSHAILAGLAGVPPRGWRSPGGVKTSRTMAVLGDLGYIYDSSDKDYDQPYPAVIENAPSTAMIELPNNTSSLDDDAAYFEASWTPGEVLDLWTAEFDAIYQESGYFLLTTHPRAGFGSGQPARARVIDRLLARMKGYPGVEFVRLGDLAAWCLDPAHGFLSPPMRLGARV